MNKIQFRAFIPPIVSAIRIGGDTMRITIDIPKTEHSNAVPLQALLDVPLRITVEVDTDKTATPKPNEKERQLKGPFSLFWEKLCRGSIKASPELTEYFDCEAGDEVWDRLHGEFDVDTMADVSPEAFEAWAKERGLVPLVTRSRLAAEYVRQNTN